ncbi:unnamed protein product [Urochloa humidicola]
MEKAWNTERSLPVQRLENNRYIIEFESQQMHDFVTNGGPWRHKGDALIVVPYDGFQRPSEVVIDAVNVWVRFYDVPVKLRTPTFSAVLAKKVSSRVLDGGGPVRNQNFSRARVALVLEEPLKPTVEVKVKDMGLMSFEVGYENVPFFCFICGRMGHSKRECPEEEEDSEEEEVLVEEVDGKKKRKLGEWMRKSLLKRGSGMQLTMSTAPRAVNRTLNFSGDQLARIQAASSAVNSGGSRRKLKGDEGNSGWQQGSGAERSLLKLPWKVTSEFSNSVQKLAVGEEANAEMRQGRSRVSGLFSFAGSTDHSVSAEDLTKGRDVEVQPRGIQQRLREAKEKKANLLAEKKGRVKRQSPIKDLGK